MERKTKLKVLLLLCAILAPCNLFAGDTTFVVELTSGKIQYYKLVDKPVVRLSGSDLKVSTNGVEINFKRTNVKKCYFADKATVDVRDIVEERTTFTQTPDGSLVISNISDADPIAVSDLAGRLYSNCVSRNGSEATISLGTCPKGVYIINVGKKQTIKITRR